MKRSLLAMSCLLLLTAATFQDTNKNQETVSKGQQADTLLARQYMERAGAFADSSQYDSAISHYQKAASLYKENQQWRGYIEAYNAIGDNFQRQGNYEMAEEYLKEIIHLGLEKLGEQDSTLASIYHNMGIIYYSKGSYSRALQYYQKALDIGLKVLGKEHSNVASSYNSIGNIYADKGSYDLALKYHQKALNIWLKVSGSGHLDVAAVYANIGSVYRNKGSYDRALEYLQKALHIQIQVLGMEHADIASSYYNMGIIYYSKGSYSQALKYLQKAIDIGLKVLGAEHPNVASSYNGMANIYVNKGYYDQALKYHHKALDIWFQTLGAAHPYVAGSYIGIGIVYGNKGNYDKALEYLQKALDIQFQVLGFEHSDLANSYHNIGMVYHYRGSYDQALRYFQKAMDIWFQVLGANHPNLLMSYSSIGNVYLRKGNYHQALKYYQKVLDIYIQGLEVNHLGHADTYSNIGIVYFNIGSYDKALEYFQIALDMWLKFSGAQHPNVGVIYNNIGSVYKDKGHYDQALEYYQNALDIKLKVYGGKHPDPALTHRNIGVLYREQNKFIKALYYCQKALINLVPDFNEKVIKKNPQLEKMNDAPGLLKTLHIKATTLEQLYHQESHSLEDLCLSVSTYQLAIQLIDKIKSSYKAEKAKLFFAEKAHETYHQAIGATMQLYELTGEDTLLQQAFTFAEKNKAGVLREVLQESQARFFAGIPDSLLDRERELKVDLNYYEAAIQKMKLSREPYDTAQLQDFENRFFDLNREYEAMLTLFEGDYPGYYELKYDTRVATVAEIREKLPDAQSALIEYVVADSMLYTFVITKEEDLKVHRLPINTTFHSQVDALKEMLSNSTRVSNKENRYRAFTGHASALYQKLLAPALKGHPELKQLIIISDGVLASLPFEVLLTREVSPQTIPGDYRTLPYLLRDYRIRYAYSAELLLEKESMGKAAGSYIGFAPEYPAHKVLGQNDSGLVASRDFYRGLRKTFIPLGYNQREVQRAYELMGGRALLGTAASKSSYEQEAPAFRILHFAGHSRTNDSLPLQSALVFGPPDDSSDYDFLYAYEVYNQSLQAELAVLSACQTGLGKQAKGEGLMSLARAFRYAGCPSIATSLWNVNDEATGILMKEFFKQLKAGSPKDEALRQAKLHVLEHHDQKNPHYWAAFILIGDDLPVQLGSSWERWWRLAGGFLVLVLLVLLVLALAFRLLKRRK